MSFSDNRIHSPEFMASEKEKANLFCPNCGANQEIVLVKGWFKANGTDCCWYCGKWFQWVLERDGDTIYD